MLPFRWSGLFVTPHPNPNPHTKGFKEFLDIFMWRLSFGPERQCPSFWFSLLRYWFGLVNYTQHLWYPSDLEKLYPAPQIPIFPGETQIPSTPDTHLAWKNYTLHLRYPPGLEKLPSTSDTWPGETTRCTSDNHLSGINYILHRMLRQITVCPGETTFPD